MELIMFLRFNPGTADDYIVRYCRSCTKDVEYGEVIAEMFSSNTMREIDERSFFRKSLDSTEQMIIDRICSVIRRSLSYVRRNNSTGFFGVIRNTKRWNSNWSYLNLNENSFIESKVIYAASIEELEEKVKSANSSWYVFDESLAQKTRQCDIHDMDRTHRPVVIKPFRQAKPKSRFEGMSAKEKIMMKRKISAGLQSKGGANPANPYGNLDRMFR